MSLLATMKNIKKQSLHFISEKVIAKNKVNTGLLSVFCLFSCGCGKEANEVTDDKNGTRQYLTAAEILTIKANFLSKDEKENGVHYFSDYALLAIPDYIPVDSGNAGKDCSEHCYKSHHAG